MLIEFSPQFEKMRNFMLGFDKYVEPLKYVAESVSNTTAYPPHNLYKSKDGFVIEMALAGFNKKDVELEVSPNLLTIKGEAGTDKKEEDTLLSTLFKGIAARRFTRVFYLGEHMKVTHAEMKEGLLTIKVEKVIPDAEKTVKIKVQ